MESKQDAKASSKKTVKAASQMDEEDQYYGLTKQEIEWRKKMAAKFGRKPTHLDPNTIEETKDNKKPDPSKYSLLTNFLNRKSGNQKQNAEGNLGKIKSH